MIIIADDTFVERHKFHDIGYLNEGNYLEICKVFSVIKTTELSELVKLLPQCELFCNHKSLQLYNAAAMALNTEDNVKYRESLLIKIAQSNIPHVEFSRGLETNFEAKKIDKDLFYTNLKALLDYYIENKRIEERILFFGENFQEMEKLSIIKNMMAAIREMPLDDFVGNASIENGLAILYPAQKTTEVIERWRNDKFSKSDIIREINNKI
jgi:hypothetical protein